MSDKFYNQLQKQIVDRYKKEVKDGELDMREVAAWALRERLWDEPLSDKVEKLRKQLASMMRANTFVDEDGNKIRSNYCVRRHIEDVEGKKYVQTVWAHIDVATHDFMKTSFAQRRQAIADTCTQAHIDKEHWNKFRRGSNPEIQLSFDFINDVADRLQSTEYIPAELEVDDL